MIKRLSPKERSILSYMDYEAQGPHSIIKYVYFIVVRGRVIYVGQTGCPYWREISHRTWLNAKGIFNYRFVIIGPLKHVTAHVMEATEIFNRRNDRYLINKNKKTEYNEYCKKISAKNYRQKAVSVFRKGSKIKTVVGQFLN